MVMTANMLYPSQSATSAPTNTGTERERRGGSNNAQQVSDAHNDRVHDSADRVDAEPPRARDVAPPLHDADRLLDAVDRQRDVLLGVRVARERLRERRLAGGGDVAAAEVAVQPAGLLEGARREQQAGHDGEHHEEDAGAGVGARAAGRPGARVERRGRLRLEDHGHHHGAHGAVVAARRGRVAHVAHAVHAVALVAGERR